MWVVWVALGVGVWMLLVVYANLNAYPALSHEPNDYGEKHRTS